MKNKIEKSAFVILILLLFLLPLHAFATVFLNYGIGLADVLGSPTIISMWKEFLIALLTVLLAAKFITEKKFPKLDGLDSLILIYMAFGVLHALIVKVPIGQFVWGARYDYVFLWVFLLVRHIGFSREQINFLFKTTLLGGVFSLILGYLIHFVLGPENLTALGFRNDWSTWYQGQSLAFCQKIENQELCRMSGTFAGPNQLGAYLVILLPLVYMWRKEVKIKLTSRTVLRAVPALIFLLAIYALLITYSRGAYIGAAVAFATLMVCELRLFKKYWKYFLYGIFALVLFGGILLISGALPDELLRPESTGEHFVAWTEGINQMLAHPLGLGLGSAGPASYRTLTPIIPESWYLQVGVELGFIGLALFIAVLVAIAKKLHTADPAILASFLGVLAIAFFLHTLEDSAVSLTLFTLIGLALTKSSGKIIRQHK